MLYVKFHEADHTYTNTEGELYRSATQLISIFKSPFNGAYWSLYKAVERFYTLNNRKGEWWSIKRSVIDPARKDGDRLRRALEEDLPAELPYILEIQETILAEWKQTTDIACERGTRYHLYREQLAYNRGYEELPGTDIKGQTVLNYTFDLRGLSDGYYSELLVYNHQFKLAGQVDKLWITTVEIPAADRFTYDDNQLYQDGNRWFIRYIDIDDYKGFALDTPIPTVTGWKQIGDIVVGEQIYDGHGKPTTVTHVSQIHHNPCYKITFDTNDTLTCDHEHKWVISVRDGSRKKGSERYKEIELTTEELVSQWANRTSPIGIRCTGISMPDADLPIDPYVLGLWLGDGNRCAGTITNLNPETWEEIKRRGYHIGDDISSEDKAETRTVFKLYTELGKLGLLKNKHLPDLYARASHNQRLDLLRGFMDADGHYNRKRNRCVMRTTKPWQVKAMKELTASLGYKPTVISSKGSGFGKSNIPMWDICFTPTESPFLTRNTDYEATVKTPGKYSALRYITTIERVDTVPTKCLAVDSPDHTYLAGSTYIKTHNTNKEIKVGNKFQTMQAPLDHLPDCNFNHYKLQISLYAWMMEQQGYVVRHTRFTHVQAVLTPTGDEQPSEADPTVFKAIEIPYSFPYQRDAISAMLTHYRQYYL